METLRALERGTHSSRPRTIRKVAEALGVTSDELHELAATIEANQSAEVSVSPPKIERHRLFRLLAERTRLTANRTNVVRGQSNLPQLTLDKDLYVRRDVENDILRLVQDREIETNLILIEGEPGTGKSSLLWSIQRQLYSKTGIDVWLVDAIELAAIFGEGSSNGTILSADFQDLFELMRSAGRQPVLLIDTVDVVLNTKGRDDHLFSLLADLSVAELRVLVASRPGEARKLLVFGPRVMRLAEYSDEEFKGAVGAYARAFVRAASDIDVEAHAHALLDAAAQGYPIKEICRNPLTLRMLYSVYAPQQINAVDIDVVSLYRSFWERRVQSDIRTDAAASPANEVDLSQSAMRIATVMLVEGLPELPVEMLARELENVRLRSKELQELEARGVIRISDGPNRLVDFFHQTFFEHAAALAILRLGGLQALQAFVERWTFYHGNLFLGATLERALVLAELELLPVREGSQRILINLLDHGPAGLSVLVYVFVHRASIPQPVDRSIRELVTAGDAMVVERLLDLAGNAARPRRLVLIEVLGLIIATGNSRWLRRALELLRRFSAPDVDPVAKVIKSSKLGQFFIDRPDKAPEARALFLDFLGQYFPHDPEWVLDQLASQFSDCIRRRADEHALQLLRIVNRYCSSYPKLAATFECRAGIDRADRRVLTVEAVIQEFGRLFYAQWRDQGVKAMEVLAALQIEHRRGLSLMARLRGLADLLLQSDSKEIVAAFQQSARVRDQTTRSMLGHYTWTNVLQHMALSDSTTSRFVFRSLRTLCGDILITQRTAEAEILFHVVVHAPMTKEFIELLLGKDALRDATPWLQPAMLGRRLIEGRAAGISGAKKAMMELVKCPDAHPQLWRAALAQIRQAEMTPQMTQIGMELAAETKTGHAEAIVELLQRISKPSREWGVFTPNLRSIITELRSFGDVRARRRAISIELEMSRLRLDEALNWESVGQLVQQEPDDINQALLVKALGYLIKTDYLQVAPRLEWLIGFAKDKGQKTRRAVLEIVADLSYDCPAITAKFIHELFDIAFEGNPDGNIVSALSTPMFVLYKRNDPQVLQLAETFVNRCAPLNTGACRRATAKFRRLFGLIMRRMDQPARSRLLATVPGLDRQLARMIVQGAAESDTQDFGTKLKFIAENPATHPEIITLARRFLRRELRVSGLERWPELYKLVVDRRQPWEADMRYDTGNGNLIERGASGVKHFVIVGTDQELDAIVEHLEGALISRRNLANHLGRKVILKSEGREPLCIGLICAGGQGVGNSTNLIHDIVQLEQPRSIMMVGMMGGLPDKVSLLTVVCPESIYDGSRIGTREGRLTRESEGGPLHPAFADVVKNMGPVAFRGGNIDVVKRKKIVTVDAKIDDIQHELATKILEVDSENVVGIDKEAFALVNANNYQLLHKANVVYGVLKGVADYCSTRSEISNEDKKIIEQAIDLGQISGALNPTDNKQLKTALQKEATVRAFAVALDVLAGLKVIG